MWPLVIWLCRKPKYLSAIAVIVILACPVIRASYDLHGIDPYMLTFARLDGLAIGAAFAIITTYWSLENKPRLILLCLIVAICLLPLNHWDVLRKAFKDTSLNLLWVSLVAVAFYFRGSSATRILRFAPLRFFGKISYCAYLVHLACLSELSAFPVIVRLSIATLISAASWYLFESPILRLKNRLSRNDAVITKPASTKVLVGS